MSGASAVTRPRAPQLGPRRPSRASIRRNACSAPWRSGEWSLASLGWAATPTQPATEAARGGVKNGEGFIGLAERLNRYHHGK